MQRNAWPLALGLGLLVITLWGIGSYSMYHNDRSPITWPAPTNPVPETGETARPAYTPFEPTATSDTAATSTPLPTGTVDPSDLTVTAIPPPAPSPPPLDLPPEGRFIVVHQGAQLVHVYEDGVEVRTMPCSTGLPDPQKNTPAWEGVVGEYWGTFFAYDVYADEAWYLFKSLGSILIHSSPYTLENDVKVYQDIEALGVRPASHGCVRMSPEDARWFTEWGPEGVPIVITPLEGYEGEEDPQ